VEAVEEFAVVGVVLVAAAMGAEGAEEGTRAFICSGALFALEYPPNPKWKRWANTARRHWSQPPASGSRLSASAKQGAWVPACLNNQTTRGTQQPVPATGSQAPARDRGNPDSHLNPCSASNQHRQRIRIRRCLRRHGFWATSAECAARPSAPAVGWCAIDKSGHGPTTVAKSLWRAGISTSPPPPGMVG
jgi:hypothetical protein